MASGTSVLKLTVDDSEYNASLKEAQQGLQHLGQALQNAGKSFDDVDSKVVDYVRSIGQMEAVSKSARGRIGEMSTAFVNLSMEYNKMTEQEKQSPVGKALAESLADLRERTVNAKEELANLNKQLEPVNQKTTETGGVMGMLKDKLTVNIDAMKLFSVGLQAAKAALDVAKDAFFASEANVDEWGRTVDSAKSLYQGFLTAINTGDISGFLGRIDEIVQAARKAYDELDRLGTMKTIQSPQMSRQQAENERIRSMIMTGKYIAPMDGRANTPGLVNGQQLTPEQIRVLERQLKGGMDKIVGLVSNEVKQTGKAIDAVYERQALELGMSLKEFKKGTSSMDEFDKRIEGAKKYNEWQYQNSFVDQTTGQLRAPRSGNPYAQYKGWDVFRVDGERYNDLVKLIQQRDQQLQSVYTTQAQAFRTINRAEGTTVRNILKGGSGGSGTGGGRRGSTVKPEEILPVGSVAALNKELSELQKQQTMATNTVEWESYNDKIKAVTNQIKELKGELGIEALRGVKGVSISGLSKDEATTREDILKKGDQRIRDFKSPTPKDKTEVKLSEEIGKMTSGISSIVGGIESLGVELPQGLQDVLGGIQGVISILTGISTIITAIEAISAADAVIPFANGGIVPHAANGWMVPGNDHSDRTLIAASSGELILNRAQQGVLASQLQDVANGGGYTPSHISGEQIYIALNRYTRRTGKGELVTWR
ncbi:MAG: hypothetical protein IKB96_12515 [Prevotella sp.]|nr:hypothetical protein [Prevotella sp.]